MQVMGCSASGWSPSVVGFNDYIPCTPRITRVTRFLGAGLNRGPRPSSAMLSSCVPRVGRTERTRRRPQAVLTVLRASSNHAFVVILNRTTPRCSAKTGEDTVRVCHLSTRSVMCEPVLDTDSTPSSSASKSSVPILRQSSTYKV
jgi:hypothetical protein